MTTTKEIKEQLIKDLDDLYKRKAHYTKEVPNFRLDQQFYYNGMLEEIDIEIVRVKYLIDNIE